MIWLNLGLILILNIANGVFSASEIAVVSARRGRLEQRAASGSRGAQQALDLTTNPNRFLATVQVGITLITVFAAAFGGDVLAEPLGRLLAPWLGFDAATLVALALVVLLLTYLSLIIGELVPKRLALQHAEGLAVAVAPLMIWIARFAAPLVWFLTLSTELVLHLVGQNKASSDQVTEEDVLSLVREGTKEGTVEAAERELIERVFDFTDASARSIMTPRTEVFALAIDTPLDQAITEVVECGYSRIPVYRGSLDTVEGLIFAKDLLRATQQPHALTQLTELLRPPVFVLEHQPLGTVLQLLRQSRTHLAMVVDEYGQVDGLLTLEDVLEELTGDIADEFDEHDTLIVRREDGSFLVDGMLGYGDAAHRIGLPSREQLDDLPPFDTVAGLLLALLGRIPHTGEIATWQQWRFEVMDMDGVRIDRVLIQLLEQPGPASSEALLALSAVLPPPTPASDPETPSLNTNGSHSR